MAQQPGWTTASIPDLTGTTAVVTVANSGLGFETAAALAAHGAALAAHGAAVTLAVRDTGRGDAPTT